MWILAINPGGGSTKVAVFNGPKQTLSENVEHPPAQLVRFGHVLDQYSLRKDAVLSVLTRNEFDIKRVQAIVTRGGPLRPLSGGVYQVTNRVVADIRRGVYQTLHPALLGPLIAWELAQELAIKAYFVDPESTDEFSIIARVTGLKGVERAALSHALSCRTVAQAAAKKLGKPYTKCNFVVAHLGTGITVAAHIRGRQVDASNANDEGPMSPQRTGRLPLSAVVRLCFSTSASVRAGSCRTSAPMTSAGSRPQSPKATSRPPCCCRPWPTR
jgi:butyrate kinase